MAHTLELRLILRIALDPQTRRKHKLPDRGAEPGQKCIERLPPAKHPCQRNIPFHDSYTPP